MHRLHSLQPLLHREPNCQHRFQTVQSRFCRLFFASILHTKGEPTDINAYFYYKDTWSNFFYNKKIELSFPVLLQMRKGKKPCKRFCNLLKASEL